LVEKISSLHKTWDCDRFDVKPNVAEMYRGWLAGRVGDSRSVFLVAERNGSIVGYLVGTIEDEIPIYWVPACGYIHDIWIEPDYRHEGLGRQMTTLAVEQFGELGVSQVRLTTAAANDVSRAMFERCGFRVATIEMMVTLDKARAGRF